MIQKIEITVPTMNNVYIICASNKFVSQKHIEAIIKISPKIKKENTCTFLILSIHNAPFVVYPQMNIS